MELDSEHYLSESTKAIAQEFKVPWSTAFSWERNIGDVEVLKETLGRNGPNNYLELISRRERISPELEDREKEWVQHLKRWCTRRTDGVYLVHESDWKEFRSEYSSNGIQSIHLESVWRAAAPTDSTTELRDDGDIRGINWTTEMAALQEELKQKEERVKYEMRRVDPDWIGLVQELRKIDKELIDIYQTHLADKDRKFQYKKGEIIELKSAFPYLRANTKLVTEATDSSISYANKFKYIPGKGVANRETKSKRRDEVLERDDNTCVSCGSEDELQVHHIIPRSQGGKNETANLATLCADCHYYAHGGGAPTDRGYSAADWDSVEYEGQSEFWDEWVNRSFEERPPKGFTRVDFEPDQ
ncbi:HNH endonuclease [Halovivax gelatinilyticus]|uniref:HNH endonuclease n=1 Tax=Halovivax gelatinilyticus TaxID=2961597 RepID=UPI0020CA2C75|nr:HNH endonuclease [Halovivax gelatinilyticus]